MTGRQETDERYREYTKRILQDKPNIIKDYYYFFGNKTEMTRFHYIRNVIEFLNHMEKENGISFNSKTAKKILPIHINKYLARKKVSDSSLKVIISALRSFFEYLKANEYIIKNPCDEIPRPKDNEKKDIVFMTPSEIKGIMDKIKISKRKKFINRDMLIFSLGCAIGLRATSIVEINLSDIDFENNIVKVVTKGDKTRECQLSRDITLLIKDWIKDRKSIVKGNTNALFVSSVGKRMTYQALYKTVKKYTENLDKVITPHKMRSSCATNLYEKTGDIYLVQDQLGHKQISNTKRYTKISKEKKANAVAMLSSDFL